MPESGKISGTISTDPKQWPCHDIPSQEVPSPDGKLRAVVAHAKCKDGQGTPIGTKVYILDSSQPTPDQSVPALTIIFRAGSAPAALAEQNVPVQIAWQSASTLLVLHPRAAVASRFPTGNDAKMKALVMHGVKLHVKADSKVRNSVRENR